MVAQRSARSLLGTAALAFLVVATPSMASAKGSAPEDALKGKVILSDKPIPTRWTSVGAYVAQLKGMNKSSFWYDKKSKKVTLQYAAFFAQPVNDVQVDLVIYDITAGAHTQKTSTENFMNRGDRVLFNSVTLDAEDFEGNRKYLFVIEYKRRLIASTTFTLRAEGPHYSGQVSFSDDETKEK